MYETTSDITQKLAKTIILYKDDPIIVFEFCFLGEDTELGLKTTSLPYKSIAMKPPSFIRMPINDPDLDFRGISEKLGYANNMVAGRHEATWLARIAVRKPIQGLHENNLHINTAPHVPLLGAYQFTMGFWDIIGDEGFVKMVRNNYPSLEKIKKAFGNEKMVSVAFHKHFCVSRREIGPYILEYKGRRVGWSEDLDKFKLDKSYKYLEEVADHNAIPAAA